MKFYIKDGLPFTEINLSHEGKEVFIDNVLIDTGSASTIISTEVAISLDLGPSPDDELIRIRGVGGSEYVYEKCINKITLGAIVIEDLKIDVGAMDYGFDIKVILGMDFLIKAKAIIDIERRMIYSLHSA